MAYIQLHALWHTHNVTNIRSQWLTHNDTKWDTELHTQWHTNFLYTKDKSTLFNHTYKTEQNS